MKLRLLILERAQEDFEDHFAYLAQNADFKTAQRFEDEVFASFELLLERPLIGTEREYFSGSNTRIRMWFVKGFPNVIFYRINGEIIEVIRMLHSSRDIDSIVQEEPID